MIFFQRLNRMPTTTFIWGGLIAAIGAMVLDRINGPLLSRLPALHFASEFVSLAVFWISLFALLGLIPISLFRPVNRFSMRGDCVRRAKNLLFCAGSVMLVLAIVASQIARAF